MKNLKLFIALALVLPIIPSQATAQKKVLLKYNVKQGERYFSHQAANQDIDMQAQGQTISMNQVVTTDITTVISKVTSKEIMTTNKLAGQSLNLSGTQNGEVVVNTKTGWIMSSHMTEDIKMKVEKNGMEIPMNISSTITSTTEKR